MQKNYLPNTPEWGSLKREYILYILGGNVMLSIFRDDEGHFYLCLYSEEDNKKIWNVVPTTFEMLSKMMRDEISVVDVFKAQKNITVGEKRRFGFKIKYHLWPTDDTDNPPFFCGDYYWTFHENDLEDFKNFYWSEWLKLKKENEQQNPD